eukprot:CAMPEP_0116883918 /NCGR_PEP_ID=MMETSP0463-20121206/16590_1 /TAXON_ID=181622 /ORGANISM="Strombidinopsis sp, Strain SopsisLIS2011" /LENGTH=74 /DNA_ID=CAMNT_0004539463 /DNA_START=902 /DNA_END=1123 /DNA_ORIENTATION=+
MDGRVGVGYRLFNETIYGKMLERKSVINDFSCIMNKCSEFLYQALATVTGFSIRKKFIKNLCNASEIGRNYAKW